ncbi:MAG: hypothetical protein QGG40_19000, partial [Myxococcota bacterium]|nr:hypothetical protein [Myxococcota bacterium]
MGESGRIAFVGEDRQVHVMSADGSKSKQVTFARVPSALTGWGGTAGKDANTWPCWSPDGRWLVCFQASDGEDVAGPAGVSVVQVDGVEERQLVELQGPLPIYAQWSPSGDAVAVLAQVEDELQLITCRMDEVGNHLMLEHGIPLFFSWCPDGTQVLVHVGSRETGKGRLVLRDVNGEGIGHEFEDAPGSFCTPLLVREQAIYVASHGKQSVLSVSGLAGEDPRHLLPLDGLLATVLSPDGSSVAVTSAPRGESTPYEGIRVVELSDGSERVLTQDECMAFFWSPRGDSIYYVVVDIIRNCMLWHRLDLTTGERRELCRFWPSRDQLFYLHFFEQYSVSHPLLSPDGARLVFSS